MAASVFNRLYRRVVIRQFGGLRNCMAWLLAVLLTIYLLDNYVFTRHQLRAIIGEKSAVQRAGEVHPAVVPQEPQPPVAPAVVLSVTSTPVAGVAENKKVDSKVAGIPADKAAVPVAEVGKPRPKCVVECPAGQISYYLKSGKERDISPSICFDGDYVVSEAKKGIAKRGINVVVINNDTLRVEDMRTFDVYESDVIMQRYLKLAVQDGHIILAATLDEASFHLTDEGRGVLQRYGSTLISKLSFRDNFVMIGQKGLALGSAIEKILARPDGKEFGETVEISGCLTLPLGPITAVVITEDERVALGGGPKVGRDKPNCGVKETCADDSFAAQMFTGIENKYMAKMCIGGKYVFGEGLNDAGRGLNIAVVSPKSKEVIRVGHFDTFGTDSSNLEIFIEMLAPGDIVIVVSYDEATKNFDVVSQKLFQTMGSSFASTLAFRDAWVFVGQHGINGYTTIEEVSPANGGWPTPIDKMICVPTKLVGSNAQLPVTLRTKTSI